MGTPSAGSVVLLPFPFSDLSRAKLRPAVVLADAGRDDWILCQVTSKEYADPQAIVLTAQSFQQGSLQLVSYARPGKLFTANRQLMLAETGALKGEVLAAIIDAVVKLVRSGLKPQSGSPEGKAT